MPHSRRSFVATLGASLGAALVGCATGPRREADAASTTAGASPGRVGPLGIQLYTVRSAMGQDFDGTLARIAGLGYSEVEFAGYFDRTPAQVRAALDRNHLTAPSAHVPVDALTTQWQKAVADAKVIGHRWLVVPWLPEPLRTKDYFQRLPDTLNTLGRQAQADGLRVAYHNHDFELKSVDGLLPLEHLLKNTDPALVDFEMDVYWVTFAGGDPLDWFARHPGRFKMLHLKDAAGPPARAMTPVGQGTIDWGRVLARRAQAGVAHVFVEHDNATDPFASARASHDYLAALTIPAAR